LAALYFWRIETKGFRVSALLAIDLFVVHFPRGIHFELLISGQLGEPAQSDASSFVTGMHLFKAKMALPPSDAAGGRRSFSWAGSYAPNVGRGYQHCRLLEADITQEQTRAKSTAPKGWDVQLNRHQFLERRSGSGDARSG
jgi:hypothetical protein